MAQTTSSVTHERTLTGTSGRVEVRLGFWIEAVTLLWMTVEASVALLVGFVMRAVRGHAPLEARTGETCSCCEEDCCDD